MTPYALTAYQAGRDILPMCGNFAAAHEGKSRAGLSMNDKGAVRERCTRDAGSRRSVSVQLKQSLIYVGQQLFMYFRA